VSPPDAMQSRRRLAAATLFALAVVSAAEAADPLRPFGAEAASVSVSGISSGAYMAGQYQVAFSNSVVGAGIVAGGPYGCSVGMASMALGRCMSTDWGRPDPTALFRRAEAAAARELVDPLTGLADHRVYLFSGTRDETVLPEVVESAAAFYRHAGVPETAIAFVSDMPAGHAFIVEDAANACDVSARPYVNDCDYDQAGALLAHILGPLAAPSAVPAGELVAFTQGEFLADAAGQGMAATGYVYVPDPCRDGGCAVHIAFHGCQQTSALVGDAFVSGTGLNRWADTNRLIVLYPQARATGDNPNACWDWWGYTVEAFAERAAPQLAAVHAMVARLAGQSVPEAPFCASHTALNAEHWQAGRARGCNGVFLCAVGSGDELGFAVNVSTLYESPRGSFATARCTR
jgi:poly(3-hydroxybutyrate) depolymerase